MTKPPYSQFFTSTRMGTIDKAIEYGTSDSYQNAITMIENMLNVAKELQQDTSETAEMKNEVINGVRQCVTKLKSIKDKCEILESEAPLRKIGTHCKRLLDEANELISNGPSIRPSSLNTRR